MKPILLLILILLAMNTYSQSELPLSEVKENPEKYSATLVVSRMIEGAGLRYYWATHELRPEDLDFKPSEEARTCRETLEHIHGLSQTILSASKKRVNSYEDASEWEFETIRKKTLENFEEARLIFRHDPEGDLSSYEAIFQGKSGERKYPFWNMINGPIEDAVWHVGQVVSFRRSSGNPFPGDKISLFSGKRR